MPIDCPYCHQRFPYSDTINARHKAVCSGWQAVLGDRTPRKCLCGHESTSATQMKRHHAQCDVWKARHRGTVQMARLAETLQAKHGQGITHMMLVPGAREHQEATNLERYGAENVFSRESSIFDKVQASLEGKRPILRGQDNPFAWPEVKEKIRLVNMVKYGGARPQCSPVIRARTQITNLERYGVKETLAAPVVRERILATNLERYGGPAPSNSPLIVEKARQTNIQRWGVLHCAWSRSRASSKGCN